MNQPYRINLEIFEGPMDLLLFLIRKNDLNIYDIPIAFITEKYLKYLNTLKELNIDFASEFLVLASELAHIKSKMLLPAEDQKEDEDEGIDPRADLVRRLLEYQRYKEVAVELSKRNMLYRDTFVMLSPERPDSPKEETAFIEANAFQLLEVFNKILEKIPKENVRQVFEERISVNERIFQLVELIKYGQTLPIADLLPREDLTRHVVVVTLLALLEMMRLKMIKVYQAGRLETIYITGTMQEATVNEAIKTLDETNEGIRKSGNQVAGHQDIGVSGKT